MEIFIIADLASTSSPTWHEKLERQPRSGPTQGWHGWSEKILRNGPEKSQKRSGKSAQATAQAAGRIGSGRHMGGQLGWVPRQPGRRPEPFFAWALFCDIFRGHLVLFPRGPTSGVFFQFFNFRATWRWHGRHVSYDKNLHNSCPLVLELIY